MLPLLTFTNEVKVPRVDRFTLKALPTEILLLIVAAAFTNSDSDSPKDWDKVETDVQNACLTLSSRNLNICKGDQIWRLLWIHAFGDREGGWSGSSWHDAFKGAYTQLRIVASSQDNLNKIILAIQRNDQTSNELKEALHNCARMGFDTLCRLLVRPATADAATLDHAIWRKCLMRTPLSDAAYFNHFEVVKYLLACGANANFVDSVTGRTILSMCAGGNVDRSILELLISRANAENINLPDNDGKTALYHAAAQTNLELALALLEQGNADPNIRTPGPGPLTALGVALSLSSVIVIIEEEDEDDNAQLRPDRKLHPKDRKLRLENMVKLLRMYDAVE